MKQTKIIWPILLVAAMCVCFQSVHQNASTARIKVENDGGIVTGFDSPAATALPYDPYFIHANDIPHLAIADADYLAQAKGVR